MKKWKELLADKALADDMTISVNGQSYTLGQLRSEDAETEGAVSRRLKEIEDEKAKLGAAANEIANMFQEYSQLTGLSPDEILSGKKPSKAKVAEAAGLREDDPLVGELVKTLKEQGKQIESLKTELSTQKEKVLKPITQQYLNDFYESRYERLLPTLPKSVREKADYRKVLEYAEKNRMHDGSGRLDLSKAAREMYEEDFINERVESRLKDERKKLADEATLAAAHPPTSANSPRLGTPKNFKNDKGMTKSFDEVLRDAAVDTELWTGVTRGQA